MIDKSNDAEARNDVACCNTSQVVKLNMHLLLSSILVA